MSQSKGKGFFSFLKKKGADTTERDTGTHAALAPSNGDIGPSDQAKPDLPSGAGSIASTATADAEAAPRQAAGGGKETAPTAPIGFLGRLRAGLNKTRSAFAQKFSGLFLAGKKIDEDLLEELEEMLIGSDIGVQTTMDLLERVRRDVDRKTLHNGEELRAHLKREVLDILDRNGGRPMNLDQGPTIVLVVGVNGVGKTTTIGKLARLFQGQGKSVLVCAADTFRAAAVQQLEIWARRAEVEIVAKADSKDPASVVYEALERVKSQGTQVLIIDTAGRLHNNPNLMSELSKMHRIISRAYPQAPHHVLLILDAVTGQNGLQQAKQFVAKVGVTDLVVTKMDGTAKGGIIIAIVNELQLPVQFIGVGEQMDDLLPFDSRAFVDSIF